MSVGDRITEIRKSKKISLDTLAMKSGVSVSTLKKISAGITKDPQIDTLKAIANALNCTLEDFDDKQTAYSIEEKDIISSYRRLDMHGKRMVRFVIDEEQKRMADMEDSKIIPLYRYTHYDIPVSAGTGEPLDVSTAVMVDLEIEPPRGTSYILRIAGDSMEPKYHDGDFIYVHQTEYVDYGEIGIFIYQGSVYMKEYTRSGLKSLNPAYPMIKGDSDIRCLGKVLGVVDGNVEIVG